MVIVKEVVVERLSMRKVREVLRLKFDAGLSVRKIAASLQIGSGSAGNYLHRFNACGLTWPTPMSDAAGTQHAGITIDTRSVSP